VALSSKKIVVLGAGRLVGEPVGMWLKRNNVQFDVIIMETEEEEKLRLIKNADILISGIGVPHFIKPEMLKPGVVLVDAGTSEQMGKLAGDIDPSCAEVASVFTPVPGGVGPITVAGLFWNLYRE
jgi:5,10-methylene-tetrahydrofolate dehydrogenase/methenyl tetrahydrofolate cyclohydrolase